MWIRDFTVQMMIDSEQKNTIREGSSSSIATLTWCFAFGSEGRQLRQRIHTAKKWLALHRGMRSGDVAAPWCRNVKARFNIVFCDKNVRFGRNVFIISCII